MPKFFNVHNPDFPTKQDFIDYITKHHGENCVLYQTSTSHSKPTYPINAVTILSAPFPDPNMPGFDMVKINKEALTSRYVGDIYGYCTWKTVFKSYDAAKAHIDAAIKEFNNNAEWQETYQREKRESDAFMDRISRVPTFYDYDKYSN